MNNTNKIVLNTLVSMGSLVFNMIVSLFSVRLVLQALGEESYGVYIIVGGIVAMLDILNSNMSNTSMRFMAYSLGKKNDGIVQIVFNSTITIHYIIGLLSIIVLECGGWLIFKYIVNIPANMLMDAKIIYQFMIATTFITVISVPYDAVTNAHEKIWVLSLFDVLASALKLVIAITILNYGGNRLVFYGFMLLALQVLMRVSKVIYARYSFIECRRRNTKSISINKIKEILSFTGWNLFGSIAALGATQFRNLIVNHFFGVRLNAAQGIENQVGTPLNQIVVSLTRSINPQIMKSEGGGDHDRMKYIVSMGAKYSTFLMALVGIPVLIETDFILHVWLDKVPDYAVIFVQLTIVAMLIEKLTFQLNHAVSAVGDIKGLQVCGAFVNLLYLPIALLLFWRGFPPVTIYWLFLLSLLLMAVVRFHFAKKIAGINPLQYIKDAIIPVLIPIFIVSLLSVGINLVIPYGWCNFFVVVLFYMLAFTLLFWIMGMDIEERKRWRTLFLQAKMKFYSFVQ